MNIKDIVTISAPFGNSTDEFVVCGIIDADTSHVCMGGEAFAFSNQYLTKVGENGELSLNVNQNVIRDWEFRNRFTSAQLVGIMRAAMAGDDVAAIVWLKLSTASDGVDIADPEITSGVQYIAATYPELGINPSVILA